MIHISYRTRQTLRRSFTLVAAISAVLVVMGLILLLWLQRFVVYTDQGVVLDFGKRPAADSQLPQQGQTLPEVTVIYDDSPYQADLQPLSGYYISEQELIDDPTALLARLELLPAGTAVMLDVKGYRGYFYYSTAVGDHTSGLFDDITQVDALIQWLAQSELYVIARFSSLRDFVTVWDNSRYGVTTTAGSLYSDRGDYGLGYWLDPTNASVQNYLIAIVEELKELGFDEVVLDNFCYPDSDSLSISGDPAENLLACAQKIVDTCAEDGFAVSFCSDDASFQLPEGKCRLYLKDVAAADAQNAWTQATVEDKRLYLVFLETESDSRYSIENGTLRPLP